MEKVRAFVALEIPAAWQNALGELQRELKTELRSPAFRWVNPQQMHLTLRFFGSIPPGEVQLASKALTAIAAETACIRLDAANLDCFPNVRRARVLWAGLDGDLKALFRLHSEIRRATAILGEPPDDRPFTPHLTLARIKDPSPLDLSRLPRVLERPFLIEGWTAASVRLVRSLPGSAGTCYETISEHAFSS